MDKLCSENTLLNLVHALFYYDRLEKNESESPTILAISMIDTVDVTAALVYQVMKDISEVRKAMDTTQEMFEPLHQMIVMLKQHGVDVSGVQVAEKDVQV